MNLTNMNKSILLYCSVFLAGILFGDQATAQLDQIGEYNKLLMQNWSGKYFQIGNYKVKGSPYLYGESVPGELVLEDDTESKHSNMYYDLYNQEVGVNIDNTFVKLDKDISEFRFAVPKKYGSGQLVFKRVGLYNEHKLKGYFNVLADNQGKYAFLRYFSVALMSDASDMMNKDLKVFQQNYDYYIYNYKDKSLKKVKLRSKDITRVIEEAKSLSNLKTYDLTTTEGVSKLIQKL